MIQYRQVGPWSHPTGKRVLASFREAPPSFSGSGSIAGGVVGVVRKATKIGQPLKRKGLLLWIDNGFFRP